MTALTVPSNLERRRKHALQAVHCRRFAGGVSCTMCACCLIDVHKDDHRARRACCRRQVPEARHSKAPGGRMQRVHRQGSEQHTTRGAHAVFVEVFSRALAGFHKRRLRSQSARPAPILYPRCLPTPPKWPRLDCLPYAVRCSAKLRRQVC